MKFRENFVIFKIGSTLKYSASVHMYMQSKLEEKECQITPPMTAASQLIQKRGYLFD